MNAPTTGLADDDITAAHEGRDGTLWIGTREHGLQVLDRATQRLARDVAGQALPNAGITGIDEDATGRIWIGTYGVGLYSLDPTTRALTAYRSADGVLRDDYINAIHVLNQAPFGLAPMGLVSFVSTQRVARALCIDATHLTQAV